MFQSLRSVRDECAEAFIFIDPRIKFVAPAKAGTSGVHREVTGFPPSRERRLNHS
jgi:hypothetical protein